ncbi:hypothetical protein [Butyrivibrio sp. M55]|jgi:hypothetical protein|uniref:hypothetical protein n=1 Tax=Butyrivibrio sp. M55 TaxID=1855323 RepID=UPI0008E01C79|nr:hypothetical protein [Butyrivibrio sp. M55]SFU45743.1 hypothetical protein SAMN05216540_102268 [Butyrivibrio sp. M55]
MDKKKIATIVEIVPIVSAVLNFIFLYAFEDSNLIRALNSITMFFAFFGFVFFFVGRSLGKGDKTVKILGIFDIFATVSVIAIYILAFLAMAM